jgi:hypothetical protein
MSLTVCGKVEILKFSVYHNHQEDLLQSDFWPYHETFSSGGWTGSENGHL